ncbi:MAG: ABC transporter ATP-binding protein [Chitinophagaceae bacterium]
MSEFAIETNQLNFSYAYKRKVVDNVSLQVPKGSIYGFLGPNGAGKTTTIRLLTGMLLSDRDNIFINGLSLQKNIPHIYKSVGTLIETPSLYLHLTGRENLKVITTLRGLPDKNIENALSIVGLTAAANRKAREYSLGMKQRLGIGMSLLFNPDLMVLDEPANGLDPNGIIEVRELLIRLNREEGKTIFVSSHLLSEIEKTCACIGIINHGVLKYQGSLEEMKNSAYRSSEVVFKIPEASDWIEPLQAHYPDAHQQAQDEVVMAAGSKEDVMNINKHLVGMNIPVTGIQLRGGLEDWFMNIIGQDNKIA